MLHLYTNKTALMFFKLLLMHAILVVAYIVEAIHAYLCVEGLLTTAASLGSVFVIICIACCSCLSVIYHCIGNMILCLVLMSLSCG